MRLKMEFCTSSTTAQSLCHLLIMTTSTIILIVFMFIILCTHFLNEGMIFDINLTTKKYTNRSELKLGFLISNKKFHDKLTETIQVPKED